MRRRLITLIWLALAANVLAAPAPPIPPVAPAAPAPAPVLVRTAAPPLLAASPAIEQIALPTPSREFRAAWIVTVANKDWPSQPGLPVAQQQAELIALLDRAADLHFNAVCFQVRSVSDAMYASALEPWSEYLTGVQGRAPQPYYDPLAFAVAEAHKRGLALHAWFNPYRAGHPLAKSPSAASHVTRTLPGMVRHYADQTILDPGDPSAQARILTVVQDVVKRYDVDGVLLDDYFYPYPQKSAAGDYLGFPDDATWKQYGAATGLSRADWRRDNVNRLIQGLSQSVKAIKPSVQFGISPFGIWRPKNPPSVSGMDAYDSIYADSRRWLAEGWVDYLSPQIYWTVADPAHGFPVLLDWWRAQNIRGHHVWPALADSSVGGKFNQKEIPLQIQVIRQRPDPGEIHFHLRSLLDNPALTAAVRALYATPALLPASPWIHAGPLPVPALAVSVRGKFTRVQWPGSRTPGNWLVQARAPGGAWFTRMVPGLYADCYLDTANPDAVAVRAVDRLGNLGAPAVWIQKKYSTPVFPHGIK